MGEAIPIPAADADGDADADRASADASPAESRAAALRRLAGERFDVLVVGGGIVGAGCARDAAMRGLRVALVEQGDFASGTSSRSSRLLHGGLRYLAQGRVGLVLQAGREKRILHRIAPHLASPLPFLFPTYKGTDWSLGKLRLGVRVYDLLSHSGERGNAGAIGADDVLATHAGLSGMGLTGAVRYRDSFTNDARLVLDTLRSAHRHGATLLNYVRLETPRATADGWCVTLRDVARDQELEARARCVISATGPWGDRLSPSRLKLRLTKGAHVVVDAARLPVTEAVVLAQARRILFAIPWGHRVILGTTDTDYAGDPADVRTDPADVAYILDLVNGSFPGARLTAADVRSDWAGVRPLISGGRPGHPSDISRRHVVRAGSDGWIDVAGGKLTTYRLIAEDAVDAAARFVGSDVPPSRTAFERLVGASDAEGVSGLLPPPVSAELVRHYCRREWAMHVDDVIVRRTSWRHYLTEPASVAEQVAGWMAAELGWDAARRAAELSQSGTGPLARYSGRGLG